MTEKADETGSPVPHTSVSAIVRHFGGVLLVKLEDPATGAARWQFPTAAQQFGESLQQAVTRIVSQQTGVQVAAGDVVQVYDVLDEGAGVHEVRLEFEAAYQEGDLSPGQGALDVAWASGLALRSMDVEQNTAELLADMGMI